MSFVRSLKTVSQQTTFIKSEVYQRTKLERLGLGCMEMSCRRNSENSIKTIRKAIDEGITLFNTGEFYNAGESEMIVGEAMRGVLRDDYFLSVKFGAFFFASCAS